MGPSEDGYEDSAESTPEGRILQVVFEIKLSDECGCPLSDPDSRVENVRNQITDETCHAEMNICDETDTTRISHTTNRIDDSCLCLAFSDVGCVPRIQSADGDTLIVETYVSDRDVISELVEQLRAVTEQVGLKRLMASDQQSAAKTRKTTVELAHLTSKQRETAMIAVSEGYYESPRRVSLDDLAATLGITKSALSKRLTVIESKLATAVFDPD